MNNFHFIRYPVKCEVINSIPNKEPHTTTGYLMQIINLSTQLLGKFRQSCQAVYFYRLHFFYLYMDLKYLIAIKNDLISQILQAQQALICTLPTADNSEIHGILAFYSYLSIVYLRINSCLWRKRRRLPDCTILQACLFMCLCARSIFLLERIPWFMYFYGFVNDVIRRI